MGVMHTAGAEQVLATAKPAVAIAYEQVTTRHLLQDKGKIFATAQRQCITHDPCIADQFACDLDRQARLLDAIDQHWITALVLHLAANAKGCRLTFDQRMDARLE